MSELITKCVVPSAIRTGLQTTANAVIAAFVQAKRVADGLSEEKFNKYVGDLMVDLNREMAKANIKGSCTTGSNNMTNVQEEKIIQNLLCKTINNQNSGNPRLSDKSLKTLAGILNTCSDGKYTAAETEMFNKEKEAAANAIMTQAVASSLVAAGINAGYAAMDVAGATANGTAKEVIKVMDPNAVANHTKHAATTSKINPTDAFVISVATGGPLAGTGAVASTAAALRFHEFYSNKVPDIYKPKFEKLQELLRYTKQQIDDQHKYINACIELKIKNITQTIIENHINDILHLKRGHNIILNGFLGKDEDGNDIPISVSKADVMKTNKDTGITSLRETISEKSAAYKQISGHVRKLCDEMSKDLIADLQEQNKDIFELMQIIMDKVTNDTTKTKDILQTISKLLNVEELTIYDVRRIKKELVGVEDKDADEDKTSLLPQNVIKPNVMKTIRKTVNSVFGPKGGQKSRKQVRMNKGGRKSRKHAQYKHSMKQRS